MPTEACGEFSPTDLAPGELVDLLVICERRDRVPDRHARTDRDGSVAPGSR
jgi:hypothetical protein